LLSDFQKHINNKFSFLKSKKLLIAFSGGLDSLVLTHLFSVLKYDVSLAHCNFRLRGIESDLDEKFAMQKAKDLDIKYYINSFNTSDYAKKNKQSIQMAARELRYTWFQKLMQENNFDYLLTAHHADDNLETFLINLTRGTGLEGLTGIPEINQKTIRPLLVFSKVQLENYAKTNSLSWREDKSNADTKYLRNKIRHDLIPILKEINPSFISSFNHTLNNLKGSDHIIKDRIKNVHQQVFSEENDIIKISIQKLKKLNEPKSYLFELLKDFGFTEWNDVFDLLDSQSGKQILSKTHRLIKDREYLLLEKINSKTPRQFEILEPTNQLEIESFQIIFEEVDSFNQEVYKKNRSNHVVYIDKDLLIFPLLVRKWQKGDYFCPLGMQGKKKLSKYFKDEKLTLFEKENIWLLCSDNKIVWVINHRSDERFKITEQSKNILKVEIKK
jgi:tRNA(Ile)-lysidine synthase